MLYFYKYSCILNEMSTRKQPSRRYCYMQGEATWGMSWGGHRVAKHTGHDPGEQQRTPFFRLLFEDRKTFQNSVFRSFLWFSLHPSDFIYAHLYEYLFEVVQAETHACFNCAERNLRSLGNFCVGPSLKVCKLDY